MSNDLNRNTLSPTEKTVVGSTINLAGVRRGPNKNHDRLRLLLNSHNPIITVETGEEDRLIELLLMMAEELNIPLYTWGAIRGLARFNGAPLYGTDQPEQALATIALIQGDDIFLLKDFVRY